MADTNLLILAREFKNLRTKVQEILKMPVGPQGLQGEKGEQGVKGDIGAPGKNGKDGKDGSKGLDGLNGKDGTDGIDGKDGVDGISVVDARVDFDGSLVLTLSNGTEIDAGKVSSEQVENVYAMLKNGAASLNELLPTQAGNANKYLKTDGVNTSWDTLDGSDIDLASPPVIGDVTPNVGTFTTLTATGQTSLGGAEGSESLRVLVPSSTGTFITASGGSIGAEFRVSGSQANNSLSFIARGGSGALGFSTNNSVSNQQFRVSNTNSAVNYVQVTGAATGGSSVISAQGSDTQQILTVLGRGTNGGVSLGSSASTYFRALGYSGVTAVNYLQVQGTDASRAPVLSSQGSDTNISQVFQSKGTGAIDLAAGSSGVNISNGGTVTAITRTAAGTFYTSLPTLTISPPTTAGGVQATATPQMAGQTVTVQAAGTGYVVGNTLTVVGGTFSVAAQLRVDAINGSGGVTATSFVNTAGAYSVLPTNPASVTGGAGSGATFNITQYFFASQGPIITNAGSGYVEQPTVTFSGGGGSGAAAYARVGGPVTLTSLGSTLNLGTEAGVGFRVLTAGVTATDMWQALSVGTTAILRSSNATTNGQVQTAGTGGLSFGTNGGIAQLFVAHTASAVNYVQVTGAATGSSPTISAQGSDASIPLTFNAKGSNGIVFQTRGTGTPRVALQLIDSGSASVNFMQIQSNISGAAPNVSCLGTDTNIDLALTPKGTGNVRFGTYTASMALTVQGYIEIKDSGGTVRKLAVIA
jgi:phosphotransferase system HPr-like phosphotransfer protein